jgi:hypothetical protein
MISSASRSGRNQMDCIIVAFGMICFDAQRPTSAQVLEILRSGQSFAHFDTDYYRDYSEYREYSYRTARRHRRYRSNNMMSGPWEWPAEAPRRRLDGTLLSDPIQVYGPQIVYPFFYPWQPYPFSYQLPQPVPYRSPSVFPYDWRSESSYSLRRGAQTRSMWWQQNRPDEGPLSGVDRRGNPWTFDTKTRTYQNLGTGEVCQGRQASCVDR